MQVENYIAINREAWNKRAELHYNSDFYGVKEFIAGENPLNDIELEILGDVRGKSILHLQCHFGMDSLALARMGAAVTGVDLSDKAIAKAEELADKLGLPAKFICSDVYELPGKHSEKYDIVFTTYGTIGWLPDMDKWAGVVAHFLKPGGRLVFAEFHPVVWMFDNEFKYVQYSYFNAAPIVETITGTYAAKDSEEQFEEVGWNHSLEEVLNSLIRHNISIKSFREYDYSPYDCFKRSKKLGERKYMIEGMEGKLPMVYSVEGVKVE